MSITLEQYQLTQLVNQTAERAAQLAAQKALEMAGMTAPFLTLQASKRQYGVRRVSRWIKEGRVKPVFDGANCPARVPVSELITAALTEDRFIFYKNKAKEDQEKQANKK